MDKNVVLYVILCLVQTHGDERLRVGDRVTTFDPLPQWQPVVPEPASQGWVAADRGMNW